MRQCHFEMDRASFAFASSHWSRCNLERHQSSVMNATLIIHRVTTFQIMSEQWTRSIVKTAPTAMKKIPTWFNFSGGSPKVFTDHCRWATDDWGLNSGRINNVPRGAWRNAELAVWTARCVDGAISIQYMQKINGLQPWLSLKDGSKIVAFFLGHPV